MTPFVDEEMLRKFISVIVVAFVVIGGGSWIIINNHQRQLLGGYSHATKHLDNPTYDGLYQTATQPAEHDMSHMSGM